jgi:redox-sensitive bicupin YhaK (pirin superfamily)
MPVSPVLDVFRLGFPWATLDPFLFCVHHLDAYPRGNEQMGPDASLAGRDIGQDFSGRDGWSMYHGSVVPGFPRHPHRGFETVTIARQGFIDHSDSLGATARFGGGDVQWMTAGRGVEHSEMFPLVRRDADNTGELFQIWLNLPRASKMAQPYFSMLWSETISRATFTDSDGRDAHVTLVAGALPRMDAPPPPPPDSWAARPESDILIATIGLAPGASFTLPPAAGGDTNRVLYFFRGGPIRIGDNELSAHGGIRLAPREAATIENGGEEAEFLVLQGRPIGEPVAQYGPFVMNSREEIEQAFLDYRRGSFGRWPWPDSAPTHARDAGRFAIHADGRREEPPAA